MNIYGKASSCTEVSANFFQKMGDGETIDEESMESDLMNSGGQPTFQSFLLQFLDTKAPIIGKHPTTCDATFFFLLQQASLRSGKSMPRICFHFQMRIHRRKIVRPFPI